MRAKRSTYATPLLKQSGADPRIKQLGKNAYETSADSRSTGCFAGASTTSGMPMTTRTGTPRRCPRSLQSRDASQYQHLMMRRGRKIAKVAMARRLAVRLSPRKTLVWGMRVLLFVGDDVNNHNLLQEGRPFIMRFQHLWRPTMRKRDLQDLLEMGMVAFRPQNSSRDSLHWHEARGKAVLPAGGQRLSRSPVNWTQCRNFHPNL